jgi:hypothetical protein
MDILKLDNMEVTSNFAYATDNLRKIALYCVQKE